LVNGNSYCSLSIILRRHGVMNVMENLKKTKPIILGLLFILMSSTSLAQKQGSVNTQILQYFPNAIFGSNPQTHEDVMGQLLSTDSPPTSWPAFPRTWLELGIDRTQTTNTAWTANVYAFRGAIPVIGSLVNIGASAQVATEYKYNVNTTFIAISSLRSIDPKATENSKKSIGTLPTNQPPNKELRKIIKFNEAERRAYFNVDSEHPVVGVCKFEMTLKIAQTQKKSFEFLVRQNSEEFQEVQTFTYSIYSNFISVNPELPIQEHLRTLCDKEFKEMVHYAADMEFNDVVKEIYAHYHPRSQCQLPEGRDPVDPKGDKTCEAWFNNPRYVMGSYRRDNVPRCVLGSEGIPICVLRAKENKICPVYYSKGKVTEFPLYDGSSKRITAGDYSMYRCDKGLTCKPPEGELKDLNIGFFKSLTGIQTYCKKP
jgi:hypothetical protein